MSPQSSNDSVKHVPTVILGLHKTCPHSDPGTSIQKIDSMLPIISTYPDEMLILPTVRILPYWRNKEICTAFTNTETTVIQILKSWEIKQ